MSQAAHEAGATPSTAIDWELGLPMGRNRAGAYRSIHNEVARLSPEPRQHLVLTIDKAHHLRNEVLEGLRLLSNYAMETEQRLGLLLTGLTVSANSTIPDSQHESSPRI